MLPQHSAGQVPQPSLSVILFAGVHFFIPPYSKANSGCIQKEWTSTWIQFALNAAVYGTGHPGWWINFRCLCFLVFWIVVLWNVRGNRCWRAASPEWGGNWWWRRHGCCGKFPYSVRRELLIVSENPNTVWNLQFQCCFLRSREKRVFICVTVLHLYIFTCEQHLRLFLTSFNAIVSMLLVRLQRDEEKLWWTSGSGS